MSRPRRAFEDAGRAEHCRSDRAIYGRAIASLQIRYAKERGDVGGGSIFVGRGHRGSCGLFFGHRDQRRENPRPIGGICTEAIFQFGLPHRVAIGWRSVTSERCTRLDELEAHDYRKTGEIRFMPMKNQSLLPAVAIIALTATALSHIGPAFAADGTVKIGLIVPMTGGQAST